MAVLRIPVNASDHIRGPVNAPVTVVEYGDYECPACGRAHPIVNRLLMHFHAELDLVFRHFPLTEVHQYAQAAAESAEYAAAHGRFWEMHDLLYENQDQLSTPLLFALARSLGLSEQGLGDALEQGTFAQKVSDDFLGGVRSGVNGTPTFFIGNRRYDGPFAFEPLAVAIASQIAQVRTPG
jgi:protein-disulfide isomerase